MSSKKEFLKKRILKRAHKHAFVRLTAFNPCNPENQSFRHVKPYLNSLKFDHSLRVKYKTKMNGEPTFQNVEQYGICHVPSMMALVDRSSLHWKFPEI